MAVDPSWLQNRTASARADRAVFAAMWDEGVLDLASFTVTETAGAPTMAVDVSLGRAVVDGDDQPFQHAYLVDSTAIESPSVAAAPGSNSRLDRVVLQVRDPDAGGAAGDDVIVTVLTGTPAPSPVAPALPDSAISLAIIGPIGVGKTSILNSDITDDRKIAGRKATPGVMEIYCGAVGRIPSGWLACDGSAISRTAFPALNALFEQQNYPYGNGDGSTTFNLPDMRGRVPIAKTSSGTFATTGTTGGAETRTLAVANLPAHSHTVNSHTHTIAHTHTMAHTHPIDHDHPPTSGQWVDDVRHGSVLGGYGVVYTGADIGVSADSVTERKSAVDLPNFAGPSGAASTSTTSQPSSGSSGGASPSTDSVGSGTAVSILNPYIVLDRWIIRT